MTNNEKIKAFVLEAVGCPYVYGATGQKCTAAYRRARMEQYPGSAEAIKKNCQVLSGKSATCYGCKYNGKKAYDCAQLTRFAAKAIGTEIPSGATSQWNKVDWAQKGALDSLPLHQVCFLYLERDGKMGHTGVYLGDGTVIDARGHSAGVVHRKLDDVQWSHWALLKQQEIEPAPDKAPEKEETNMSKYIVTGTRLALRRSPSTSDPLVKYSNGEDVRMETGTVITGEPYNAEWVKVTYEGMTGYSMVKFLQLVEEVKPPQLEAPEFPEEELTDKEKLDRLWAWYQAEKGAS